MFNLIEELFSPGRKHTNEERKRLELTRVDLNDGDPGKGPIDLTSGRVVVRVPDQAPTERTSQAAAPQASDEPSSSGPTESSSDVRGPGSPDRQA
ncbi:hypothetical protein DSC45_17340 [Streptomyces sp. YIM 130001]|uniref:DUF6191 domain-containing protein n=1 Tax=Streptomyces sp. YIM 130001 TaxID=2259644 RepID=UPI000E65A567|nr:DUF6191 domain-containing protein [Streptomyces sp. YIM 130001]RII15595.1 hypothetical protein DSC45_17340 [Streptomyces sp. YIM 130001]